MEVFIEEVPLDIASLIPVDAVDIAFYELDEPVEEATILQREVTLHHNSSSHYFNISFEVNVSGLNLTLLSASGVCMNGSRVLVDKLSNKTFTLTPEIRRIQWGAEVNTPVNWTLSVGNITVHYKTPAPVKIESEAGIKGGRWVKGVFIESSSSVHYSNVTAFSDLGEEEKFDLRLYWLVNGSRIDITGIEEFNVSFMDTNGNGVIDRVTWIIPLLSNQSFEIEADITIINVQSYPTVGGNWTVEFNTTGIANLTITAVDGTAWSNQPYECYDSETEILTREGWKFFYELNKNEGVLTLNPETKEPEWQLPTDYQVYQHDGEMYEIVLDDGSELLVSPEHRVYAEVGYTLSSVGIVMMLETLENNFVSFKPEEKNKTPYLNSFVFTGVMPEILEMFDGGFIVRGDLLNLLLNSTEQDRILLLNPAKSLTNPGGIDLHNSSHHLSNSSIVMAFPEGSFLAFLSSSINSSFNSSSSTGYQSILSQNSWSSADSSPVLMNSSKILFLFNSSLFTSDQFTQEKCSRYLFNCLSTTNVRLATYITPLFTNSSNFLNCSTFLLSPALDTSTQFISGCLSSFFFNSSGTYNVIRSIVIPSYYFNIRDYFNIYKPFDFLEDFSLMPITEAYDMHNDKELYFLDLDKNPVKVQKIRKVPYSGKIYDVTVKNHMILVKRGGKAIWSGNSNYDLQFLEIKCGGETLNYEWINNSVFIRNYSCNETSYETSRVLTSGKHTIEFQFGYDIAYAQITGGKLALNLTAKKKHFKAGEDPEFLFEYITGKKKAKKALAGKPEKALKKWVTENETIETSVYYNEKLTDIHPEIERLGEDKFSIKIPKARAFRAGIYGLRVELSKDNETYTEEQEFRWGLVSLNTKKSIYRPGETAEFIIVVLDRDGRSVCDADVSLIVTDPWNETTVYSTGEGSITAGLECGLYEAGYPAGIEGNHSISILAVVDGVEVFFNTFFLVQLDYEFDIIRTAESKIDPTRKDWFDVTVDIESFVGGDSLGIKEFVPAEFDVVSDADIGIDEDTKTLTWNKDLIENKTSVSYSYSIPHIWPYLYALGPSEIDYGETFKEARPWYVAVDPSFTEDLDADACEIVTQNFCPGDSNTLNTVEDATDINIDPGGDYADVGMTDPTGSGIIEEVRIYVRHGGQAGIGQDLVTSLRDIDTDTELCSYNIPNTEAFTTDNFVCSPTPSWSELDNVEVRIQNTDSAAPDDAYVDMVNVTLTYTVLPKTNETNINVTDVEVNNTICVNHTVTKGSYDIDSTWVEVTYPNGSS
ncbi:MAG: hypothetical protein U9Q22_03210, partial [Candidatus Altiarchaeota archaeon]|nr:hypothetical protein [Candidatus Altiarchaeota archaeon]